MGTLLRHSVFCELSRVAVETKKEEDITGVKPKADTNYVRQHNYWFVHVLLKLLNKYYI